MFEEKYTEVLLSKLSRNHVLSHYFVNTMWFHFTSTVHATKSNCNNVSQIGWDYSCCKANGMQIVIW